MESNGMFKAAGEGCGPVISGELKVHSPATNMLVFSLSSRLVGVWQLGYGHGATVQNENLPSFFKVQKTGMWWLWKTMNRMTIKITADRNWSFFCLWCKIKALCPQCPVPLVPPRPLRVARPVYTLSTVCHGLESCDDIQVPDDTASTKISTGRTNSWQMALFSLVGRSLWSQTSPALASRGSSNYRHSLTMKNGTSQGHLSVPFVLQLFPAQAPSAGSEWGPD